MSNTTVNNRITYNIRQHFVARKQQKGLSIDQSNSESSFFYEQIASLKTNLSKFEELIEVT